MNILSIDTGYGDCKVVYGDQQEIKNIYKFQAAVARVNVNEIVKDNRVVNYKDNNYYVGEDALSVQSSSIITIDDYQKLEYYSPLFIYKAISDLEAVPDILVLGLSIAQIKNSGYYRENITNFLNENGISTKILVVPQGAISKLTIDKYSNEFPHASKNFNAKGNYVIADIGFNTLDICHVINGQTSTNLVRGIEGRGITVVVKELIDSIKKEHKIQLTVPEAISVLANKQLKRRGQSFFVEEFIKKANDNYIDKLQEIIETEFGAILDKVDNIYLIGGGAYYLDTDSNGFSKKPNVKSEFYNAIGYYIHGVNNLKEEK